MKLQNINYETTKYQLMKLQNINVLCNLVHFFVFWGGTWKHSYCQTLGHPQFLNKFKSLLEADLKISCSGK